MVLGVAPGCTAGGVGGGKCDPLDSQNPCPRGDGFAQFCSVLDDNRCINVCRGADILGDDSCATDEQCASPLTCDNDRVAVSSCKCVLACPSVGATRDSVQAGDACSETKDCAQDLICDNEMVGISSYTCVAGTGGTGPFAACSGVSAGDRSFTAPCRNDDDCATENCCFVGKQAPGCQDPSNACSCRRSCLEDAGGECSAVTPGDGTFGACCRGSTDCNGAQGQLPCDPANCQCDECDSLIPGDGNPGDVCRDGDDCPSTSCDGATCFCSRM